MSTKVGLAVAVEAGTLIVRRRRAGRIGQGRGGVAVGSVAGHVDLVQRARAGRRRDLRHERVAVPDVDVLLAGDLVDRVAVVVGLAAEVEVHEVGVRGEGARTATSPTA